jgi:hypothetical protein
MYIYIREEYYYYFILKQKTWAESDEPVSDYLLLLFVYHLALWTESEKVIISSSVSLFLLSFRFGYLHT